MEQVKELAVELFSTLGAGFSERVYHNAMEIQLRKNNIDYESERVINVAFKDISCGTVRADLIVNNSIVVELKQTSKIKYDHKIQCEMYMKLLGLKQGLVINFPDSTTEPVECVVINWLSHHTSEKTANDTIVLKL